MTESIIQLEGKMNWYKVELTEDQIMARHLNRMQDEFQKWYVSLNAWRDTALFSRGREDDLQRDPLYLLHIARSRRGTMSHVSGKAL